MVFTRRGNGLGGDKISRLTLRRMLETAIGDGAKKLRLQEKVAETSRVDSNVGTLLVDASSPSEVALFPVRGSSDLVGLNLLIGVVDKIFLGGHVDELNFARDLLVRLMTLRRKQGTVFEALDKATQFCVLLTKGTGNKVVGTKLRRVRSGTRGREKYPRDGRS